jgi:hypothetical protein
VFFQNRKKHQKESIGSSMETSLFSSAAAVASAMAAANGHSHPHSHHQHPHLLPNTSSPSPMAGIPSPYSILAAAAASHHGQPGRLFDKISKVNYN